ncbi:MAG: hypothetical protein V1871_04220 [Planctomycetota bacterium]
MRICPKCGAVSNDEERKCECGYVFDSKGSLLSTEEKQRIYEEEKTRMDAQEKIKQEKTTKGIQSGCLIAIVCVVLLFLLCNILPKNEVGRSTDTSSSEAGDNLSSIIAKYGSPDEVDSTENDIPRPPIVTKWIIYKKQRVRFSFVPDGKITDPPPYTRWKIFGIQDSITNEVLKVEEVNRRFGY